jgi:hypothetical protein
MSIGGKDRKCENHLNYEAYGKFRSDKNGNE